MININHITLKTRDYRDVMKVHVVPEELDIKVAQLLRRYVYDYVMTYKHVFVLNRK